MLIVHLFVSYAHVNLCHFFSSSWCQGLAATSACGSSWTVLFTFVQCGGSKTTPRTSTIVQFIFYFWSFEISVNILRNQK